MRRLADFISPSALGGAAVWIVVVVAYVSWAIPHYTNVGEGPGNREVPVGTGVDVTAVVLLAIAIATTLTACLAGIVILLRRWSSR
jgi:hypothetical protein